MRNPRLATICFGLTPFALLLSHCLGCQHTGPSSDQPQRRVAVAAAADLKFAFDELIAAFHQQHPEIEIVPTYGSSGNFFAQLTNNAPFDLYFSADMSYPRQLIEAGQAEPDSERLYAVGQIVVWVPRDSPLDIESQGMQALLDESIRKIAIANPRHAPYGAAARSAMEHYGIFEQVESKLVLGENVAQTAQFIESGAADVGIIALSLALAPAMRDSGRYWLVPLEAYPRMDQGCVVLHHAVDCEAAYAFRDFVGSPVGREMLKRYGFILPDESL